MAMDLTASGNLDHADVVEQREVSPMQGEEAYGALINIAGRQRMLSQRVGLLLLGLATQSTDSSAFQSGMIAQLEAALREFDQGHEILLNGAVDQGIPRVSSPEAMKLLSEHRGVNAGPIARFRNETSQFLTRIQRGEPLSAEQCMSLTDFILGDLLAFLQKIVKALQQDFNAFMDNARQAGARNMQRVNQAVREIQEAAHFSRMIALNAKISAERAGEFGREFGALTNEIKDISERITSSSKDILELVSQGAAASN